MTAEKDTDMIDPLAREMAGHLEEMVAAAEALLATVGEHMSRRATREEPAEYVATHEEPEMKALASQVREARLALVALGKLPA